MVGDLFLRVTPSLRRVLIPPHPGVYILDLLYLALPRQLSKAPDVVLRRVHWCNPRPPWPSMRHSRGLQRLICPSESPTRALHAVPSRMFSVECTVLALTRICHQGCGQRWCPGSPFTAPRSFPAFAPSPSFSIPHDLEKPGVHLCACAAGL